MSKSLQWLVVGVLASLACLCGALAPAQQPPPATATGPFDHLATGFALEGVHATARCESCHVDAVLKGTPRDCESCHVAGNKLARDNVVKNTDHITTTQSCASCHTTRRFTGARMNHAGVARGTCFGCHNGQQASGKPPTHLSTAASCDSCHSTLGWRPATGFDHAGVAPGSCATCHNGVRATGPGSAHVPFAQVSATAAAACDACHRSGFRAWLPARVHANFTIVAQCSACHLGVRPTTPVHIGQTQCESCHKSTSTWSGARVDHSSFTAATQCIGCHNGVAATGKNPTHIPVGATNCYSCHSTNTWKPTKFNHTQMPASGQCATCHSGAYPPADGRGAAHVPYALVATLASLNCDACHKAGFASWAGGRLHASGSVGNQCKTCHNGSYVAGGAVGKPANHIPESQLLNGTTMECNACHSSTTSWVERMNHNNSLGGGAGWCKGCHQSGTNYLGKMTRMQLTHQKKTPPAVDCSESGCHRPLGNKGSTYKQWD